MEQDRTDRDAPVDDDDNSVAPKFSFAEGQGTPLGQLPAVLATGSRGNAHLQLEAALEPLHRIVYGKPGVRGSRRRALEDFRGFPDAFEPDVAAKFGRLKKDKLREIVQALGLGFTVSKAQSELAKEVVAFMMRPFLPTGRGAKKPAAASSAAAKRPRTAPEETKAIPPAELSSAEAQDTEGPTEKVKRTRKEAPVDGRAGAPSDDALRVAVYKRVLVMTRAERGSVGMRNLRDEMERLFKVPSGSLRDRKSIMAETALECVRALVDAESAAATAHSAEPSPAPQRPRVSEPAAAAVARSNAPSQAPPATPEESVLAAHTASLNERDKEGESSVL